MQVFYFNNYLLFIIVDIIVYPVCVLMAAAMVAVFPEIVAVISGLPGVLVVPAVVRMQWPPAGRAGASPTRIHYRCHAHHQQLQKISVTRAFNFIYSTV